jgi:methyl-accepting chemotaxis protein
MNGDPEHDPTVRAAWKALLGRLINEGARFRFFPHRVMMFMLLATEGTSRERHVSRQSAADTLQQWQRIARGVGGNHRLINVEAPLSDWLAEHMAAGINRYTETCGHFDEGATYLLAKGERISDERPRIVALCQFVAIDMLDCMNELVASFEAELADTARRTSGIEQRALADQTQAEVSAASARTLTARLEGVNERVQMIAFNALIKAARAGDAGQTFCAVAQEIKALSGEIGELTKGIRSVLQR